MHTRRAFLSTAVAGVGTALLARYPGLAAAPESRIDVLLDEPLGVIHPDIYGHFIEHLGGVIYDGIWVGEGSKIANAGGIRKSLIDDMRRLKAPVTRWPGGCFADSYDWMDGIGPRNQRPKRTNFWADERQLRDKGVILQRFDSNHFGTDEYLRFCRLTGTAPYVAVNIRSLHATSFYRWMEYCNSPAGSTTLAEQRAAAGSAEPYNVRYWGIGNETWGCGGNFLPEEYAIEYRRFIAWIPRYGVDVKLIASGPNGSDWSWTRRFLQKYVEKGSGMLNSLYGLSLHHYSENLARGKETDWYRRKGSAVNFDVVDWYELLREGDRMEPMIEGHWQVMGEYDRQRRVKLIVDEWGPWYAAGSEVNPAHALGQMITLRDAVMSAATLDIFNRHPEKVIMANTAQLINCLNSLFLADGDNYVRTPVFHVFEMYIPHMGATSVRAEFMAPAAKYERDGQPAAFWGLRGSASVRDKNLTISVVNPDVSQPREAEIAIHGGRAKSLGAITLTHSDIRAHNTFSNPEGVRPAWERVVSVAGPLRRTFPPASVTVLQIVLE
jgi:alpha-N-arabinofuranosidase